MMNTTVKCGQVKSLQLTCRHAWVAVGQLTVKSNLDVQPDTFIMLLSSC